MPATEKLHVKLTVEGVEIEGAFDVAAGLVPRRVVLPILRQLTDVVVSLAETRVRAEGESVSCRKGCDACCRQMVPISGAEAFALARILAELPDVEHRRVVERFERAKAELERRGLLSQLEGRAALSAEQQHELDVAYFSAGIACPFLEDGACLIHGERPLACREFLVTTPAEHCRHPTADRVKRVGLGASISQALIAAETESTGAKWVPLILCREHAAANEEKAQEASRMLSEVLQRM